MAKMTTDGTLPRLGRPPQSREQVERRVAAYCKRYGVAASDSGLPPFPSGKRESRQHKEWLALYRAIRRARERADGPARVEAAATLPDGEGPGGCAVCGSSLSPHESETVKLTAGRVRTVGVHGRCGELLRAAEAAGPDAVAAVQRLLWPRRER